MRQWNGFESRPMAAPNAERRTGPSETTLAGEVAALQRRVADLQTACEKAQRSEAAIRLAIAGLRSGLNGPLSVLVARVDLMLLEAGDRGFPVSALEDLLMLQRHLERLCRAAEVVIPVDEPDRDGLFDLNGRNGHPADP
jgi:hypothetical protein